uniref:Uncharacterized protein n=1 Tax=Lygus hesperus TaxID=30085 RepID=A0A0A9YH38_LYGHE
MQEMYRMSNNNNNTATHKLLLTGNKQASSGIVRDTEERSVITATASMEDDISKHVKNSNFTVPIATLSPQKPRKFCKSQVRPLHQHHRYTCSNIYSTTSNESRNGGNDNNSNACTNSNDKGDQ